jgi:cobalt-zinc-cadmium efflux system outer membrane protein
LPGAEATLPKLPVGDTPQNKALRSKLVEEFFPTLPDIGPDPLVDGPPGTPPVTLDELIEFARRHSPVLAQAAAEVEAARGQWVQAGLYPNPTVGYQADQVADQGTAGQQGGFINQSIVTGGKLKLARSVAFYDYAIARFRLRAADVGLTRQVRSDYYAALVAAEHLRINRVLAAFTDDLYRRQLDRVKDLSPAFEAAALRAVAGQARATVVLSRNRYVATWKRLAATLNAPDLPPVPLAGLVDEAAPVYQYDALVVRMIETHTDLAVVRNQITQAEAGLIREQRRPIPDLENNLYFQRDTQLQSFQMGVQVGVQVPVWNRNQGAIMAASAELARLNREAERVRNGLLRELVDAFECYESARQQLVLYRTEILPSLVRAFRGVHDLYQRQGEGQVNYNDLVTAQQNLATRLNDYLSVLHQQWQSVADIVGIVQADRPEDLMGKPDPDPTNIRPDPISR